MHPTYTGKLLTASSRKGCREIIDTVGIYAGSPKPLRLLVAAFLHHYITTSKDPSAPKSLMRGLLIMPLSFCHPYASRCLPNWECGSRDGFRLRQNRKLSRSIGCQIITVPVEAPLPAAALRGRQGKGISFSRGWYG